MICEPFDYTVLRPTKILYLQCKQQRQSESTSVFQITLIQFLWKCQWWIRKLSKYHRDYTMFACKIWWKTIFLHDEYLKSWSFSCSQVCTNHQAQMYFYSQKSLNANFVLDASFLVFNKLSNLSSISKFCSSCGSSRKSGSFSIFTLLPL